MIGCEGRHTFVHGLSPPVKGASLVSARVGSGSPASSRGRRACALCSGDAHRVFTLGVIAGSWARTPLGGGRDRDSGGSGPTRSRGRRHPSETSGKNHEPSLTLLLTLMHYFTYRAIHACVLVLF